MSQTFTVPWRLDGMNEYTAANRSNAFSGAAMKKRNEEIIFYAIREARIQPVSKPVTLSYVWTEPGGKRDADNIAVAQKFVQDALVSAGILKDDNLKHVCGFNHAFQDGKKHGVQVTIIEVDEQKEV
jgi:Holliday junction resolvase RusA-like endonuclease